MTQQNHSSKQSLHPASVDKRMLQGAGIAFVLISIFLLGVDEPDPDWPKLWMLRPLLIVPVSGALGGIFYYFMDHLRSQGGWIKVLAYLLSLLGYLVILWMGTILGLDGTLWN